MPLSPTHRRVLRALGGGTVAIVALGIHGLCRELDRKDAEIKALERDLEATTGHFHRYQRMASECRGALSDRDTSTNEVVERVWEFVDAHGQLRYDATDVMHFNPTVAYLAVRRMSQARLVGLIRVCLADLDAFYDNSRGSVWEAIVRGVIDSHDEDAVLRALPDEFQPYFYGELERLRYQFDQDTDKHHGVDVLTLEVVRPHNGNDPLTISVTDDPCENPMVYRINADGQMSADASADFGSAIVAFLLVLDWGFANDNPWPSRQQLAGLATIVRGMLNLNRLDDALKALRGGAYCGDLPNVVQSDLKRGGWLVCATP